jgi:hypothetical protein
VRDLKSTIHSQNSIKPQDQILTYESQVLEDHFKLEHYHIKDGDTVYCTEKSTEKLPRTLKPTDQLSPKSNLKRPSKSRLGRGAGESTSSIKNEYLEDQNKVPSSSTTGFGSSSKSPFPKILDPGSKGSFEEDTGGFQTDTSSTNSSAIGVKKASKSKRPSKPPYLLSKNETVERMEYWRMQAERRKINASTHIVDPAAHYSNLHYLEEYVVKSSEYFRCHGQYLIEGDSLGDWTKDQDLQKQIPARTMDVLLNNPSGSIGKLAIEPTSIQASLESVSKSYLILCRVLTSFDHLRNAGFCGTFFSMLIQGHRAPGVAHLAQVNRGDIVALKKGFESFISSPQGAAFGLESDCFLLAKRMIARPNPLLLWLQLLETPLLMCRAIVLLLDLGLVTYVGSHGSRFDSYVDSSADNTQIQCKSKDSDHLRLFTCSLMPLACLNGLIDTPVWVFTLEGHYRRGQPGHPGGLSILTRMDVFADIWGPVWTVTAGQNSPPNQISQYNLSRGYLRRTENQSFATQYAVMCHWDSGSFSNTGPTSNIAASSLPLSPDDILLIGAALREDPRCPYNLNHYEEDYIGSEFMGQLGTIPDRWRLEARTLGFNAGQYVGITASGSQKMLPGVTMKEHIWNEMSQTPQFANIDWLNNFLGVEISHCSGNARRIRMKDLFRVKRVRERLGRLIPNWETTPWGKNFSRALDIPDFAAIQTVWDMVHMREDIGRLLTAMLRLLHTTGGQGSHVIAAYFRNSGGDQFTDVPIKGNEWAESLRDTTHTATYAVIGDVCLKFAGGPSGEVCSQQHMLMKTALQTSIRFRGDIPSKGDHFRMKPIGKLFRLNTSIRDLLDLTITVIPARIPLRRDGLDINPPVGIEVLEDFPFFRGKDFLAPLQLLHHRMVG